MTDSAVHLADRLDCVAAAKHNPTPRDDDTAPTLTANSPTSTGSASASSSGSASGSSPSATGATSADAAGAAVAGAASWYHDDQRLVFIAQRYADREYASIISLDRPGSAMRSGAIRRAIDDGYLVRTRTDDGGGPGVVNVAGSGAVLPDPPRFHTALQSGAHVLSTNFEECLMRHQYRSPSSEEADHDDDDGGYADHAAGGWEDVVGLGGGGGDSEWDSVSSSSGTVHGASSSSSKASAASQLASMAAMAALPGMVPAAVAAVAAIAPGSAISRSLLLPFHLPAAPAEAHARNASLYCEHLPSAWPFECNPASAPYFCEAALRAARLIMLFTDESTVL